MGRYFNGDIDGKFWFAVQSSDAANRFGVYGEEGHPDPEDCDGEEYGYTFLNYFFEKSDLDLVVCELKNIEYDIGHHLQKLDEFFKESCGYNNEMLIEAGFPPGKIGHIIHEYADYCLGIQIKNCIEEKGKCYFEAEL